MHDNRPWHDARVLARLLALLGATLTAAALALAPLLEGPLDPSLVRWVPFVVYVAAVSAVGFGWTRLLQVPTGWGLGMIVALTGVAGGLLVTLDGYDGLRWIPASLAIGVIVAFVHQMGRRDGRPRLVESVSATVIGQTVALMGTGWLLLDSGTGGAAPGLLGGAACAVAVLVMTSSWRRKTALPVAIGAATLLAGALASSFDAVQLGGGLLAGAVAGTVSAGLHMFFLRQPTVSYRRAAVAAGAASTLAAGLAVHVGARLTLG